MTSLALNNWAQINIKPLKPKPKGKADNMIKQPQNEQMASRDGNSFPKTWQLSYPNLTESIFNLHNC